MSALEIMPSDLAMAIDRVRHAAGDDETRPILATVLFEGDADGFRLVASDNFRIAVCEVPLAEGDPAGFGRHAVHTWDVDLVRALLKSVGKSTLPVVLEAESDPVDGQRAMTLSHGHRAPRLVVRVVDGTYPNYAAVFDRPGREPRVAFNPRLVGEALAAAKKWDSMNRLELGTSVDPMVLVGEGFREAVIPVRDGLLISREEASS